MFYFSVFAVIALYNGIVCAQTPFHLGLHLVKSIATNVSIIDGVLSNSAMASFVGEKYKCWSFTACADLAITAAQCPVPFAITVTEVSAVVGVNGTAYASFDEKFTNFGEQLRYHANN